MCIPSWDFYELVETRLDSVMGYYIFSYPVTTQKEEPIEEQRNLGF